MQQGRSAARFILLSCLLFAFLNAGCASLHSIARSKADPKFYTVTAASTPFYHYSPSQGSGPDRNVPRNAQMTLIRRSAHFCKVRLPDGEEGFVAANDIAPASAPLLASNNVPEKPMVNSSAWRAEIPQPRPSAPEPSIPVSEPTPIPLPPDSVR